MENHLSSLLYCYQTVRYKAPFVRQVWVDKEDGSQRPLAIPAFEDKILQRAIAMLLSAIYEIDFYNFSYGFREGRSARSAIKAVREQCYQTKVNMIIDADLSKFFDRMPHACIRRILQRRVNDGKVLQLIGKWLKAPLC